MVMHISKSKKARDFLDTEFEQAVEDVKTTEPFIDMRENVETYFKGRWGRYKNLCPN